MYKSNKKKIRNLNLVRICCKKKIIINKNITVHKYDT